MPGQFVTVAMWQKEGRGRYETLPSFGAFVASLPPLATSLALCDSADLFATYSALHAKGREADVMTNTVLGFHYFLATQQDSRQAAGPRPGGENQEAAKPGDTCPATTCGGPVDAAPGVSAGEGHASAMQTAESDPGTNASPEPSSAEPATLLVKHGRRLEPVVPISSKNVHICMELLHKLFQLGPGMAVKHMLLAIVDDDGSVALIRMFNYIQPPFEGPETLPPMDAAADSDQD